MICLSAYQSPCVTVPSTGWDTCCLSKGTRARSWVRSRAIGQRRGVTGKTDACDAVSRLGAVPVLAALLPVQLPADGLGQLEKMARSEHPWSFRILPSTWPSPGHCGHLGSKLVDESLLSLSNSPSVCNSFKHKYRTGTQTQAL